MARRSAMSLYERESIEGAVEQRSKTFIVQKRVESADGASSCASFSSPETDSVMLMVNSRFDRKERQIKSDIRYEFEQRLQWDRQHNEEIIGTLRRDLSNLLKSSHDLDHMRDKHKSMQHEINNQQDKIISLKDENIKLKAESVKFQAMTEEVAVLRTENEALIKQRASLEAKEHRLMALLAEKDHEILRLKLVTDGHYRKLHLDLVNTRDRFTTERECLKNKLSHQNEMLTEISAAVKSLSGSNGLPMVVGSGFHLHSNEPNTGSHEPRAQGRTSGSTAANIDLNRTNNRERKRPYKKS